jgi:hypothetical protein
VARCDGEVATSARQQSLAWSMNLFCRMPTRGEVNTTAPAKTWSFVLMGASADSRADLVSVSLQDFFSVSSSMLAVRSGQMCRVYLPTKVNGTLALGMNFIVCSEVDTMRHVAGDCWMACCAGMVVLFNQSINKTHEQITRVRFKCLDLSLLSATIFSCCLNV